MVKFKIDGVGYKLNNSESEKIADKPTPQPFSFNNDSGITQVKESTELGDSLKELNCDDVDSDRSSGIDLRANLHPVEIPFILGVDSLVRLQVLPVSCLGFTRQKKRISVSINALGRENIVTMVGGKRDHDANIGSGNFKEKIGNFFGGIKKDD